VKSPFLAGDALDQQPSAFINQDAQVFSFDFDLKRLFYRITIMDRI
jgi:hypothetical protein